MLSSWDQVDGVLGGAVEVADRRLTDRELAGVRAGLAGYAATIPHHGVEDFGRRAKITAVREFLTYRVVLDSLYERRVAARKQEPFSGGSPPAPTVTEATIQVWSYPYPTGKEFRGGSVENRVEESRQVAACVSCSGYGSGACATCSGSGAVPCSGCKGTGGLGCRQCGGGGQVKERGNLPPEWTHCTGCRGGINYSGDVCVVCNGTAMMKEQYYQERLVSCGVCSGRGAVSCTSCGGHRQVRCRTCTGNKRVPCPPCKATGKMISYLAVVQTFEPATQTTPVPCPKLKDGAVNGLIQEADYSPFLTLTTNTYPPALGLTAGTEGLRAAIIRAFDAGLAPASAENRLTRQRLHVAVASVLEVGYEYEGKPYTAFAVGKQYRVHAAASPVTDALQRMVEEAVGTWEGGDRKAATLRLREVLDMAAADPCCRGAYEAVKDTIPADLESKARWLRWRPFLIVGGIAAAVFLVVAAVGIGYAVTKAQRGPAPPAAFDPRGRGAGPLKESTVLLEFRSRSVMLPKGGATTLRLAVSRLTGTGAADEDVTVRLEAGRGVSVPAQVVVGRGQEQIEIEVRAGNEGGVFVVKATVEGGNPILAAECRVSVSP